MEFAAFAARAAEIEAEDADLAVVDRVRALLLDSGEDLPVVSRFVQGRIFPAWSSATLDVGPSLCYEALARAAGPNVTAEDVRTRLAETGDVGAVAATLDLGGQRGLSAFAGGTDALTVDEVDTTLTAVADAAGDGSTDRKLDALFGLFNRCSPDEARYLARLVLGEMRIGVGAGSVRDAVAEAFDVPVDTVERALQVTNDHGRVAELARDEGAAGLAAVGLEVGRPVAAMLAQAGTVEDALDAWEDVVAETKYDGARVQVHVGDDVGIYSRNMEDVTDALPEVVEFAEAHVDGPAILDGEIVALADDGAPLPFQSVLRRVRRKYDVDQVREEVRVELRAFDCLHVDGEDLLDEPLTTRRERLGAAVDDATALAETTRTADADEIWRRERAALAAGHEGIMLKNPHSTYTPGSRGRNWLKRKPDVETLDLVVTGAEWGEGRRANVFGTYLLAARDDGEFRTIGKVATGLTDERLADLTERLESEVVAESGQTVEFRPTAVFEVGYEGIQRSPTYSSGYALRFPRFVSLRDDKSPDDADTLERVERLAAAQ